ncbi:hypothetical protein NE237_016930 [Protea cynaroides]|uniref:DUF4283 domain-containing protein n=1 Tax=Protea cynaroides TaxID=273540 RepID=A0A9Q0HH32_9MAGN|nr:hypothetical protein NE237_016930 [Protea cynaroides]
MHVGAVEEPFILEDDSHNYSEENPEMTLVGRIIGNKPFRRQVVTDALPSAWNTVHGVEVVFNIDKMTYSFRFKHNFDLLNVLKEAPWTVAGNLIILERWSGDQKWSFESFQIWAQIHGLPAEAMKPNVAPRLVSRIGVPSQLMIIEGPAQGMMISFLRARVTLENRCKQCYEAEQPHMNSHGCDPLTDAHNYQQDYMELVLKITIIGQNPDLSGTSPNPPHPSIITPSSQEVNTYHQLNEPIKKQPTIPNNILQNPAFINAILQLVLQFSSISIDKPTTSGCNHSEDSSSKNIYEPQITSNGSGSSSHQYLQYLRDSYEILCLPSNKAITLPEDSINIKSVSQQNSNEDNIQWPTQNPAKRPRT